MVSVWWVLCSVQGDACHMSRPTGSATQESFTKHTIYPLVNTLRWSHNSLDVNRFVKLVDAYWRYLNAGHSDRVSFFQQRKYQLWLLSSGIQFWSLLTDLCSKNFEQAWAGSWDHCNNSFVLWKNSLKCTQDRHCLSLSMHFWNNVSKPMYLTCYKRSVGYVGSFWPQCLQGKCFSFFF